MRTNLSSALQEIIVFKHDIALRIRSIIIDPIEAINREGASTALYLKNESLSNERFLRIATEIKTEFSKKWTDENASEETQLQQIQSMIYRVHSEFIPKIKEIGQFYKRCINNGGYFQINSAPGKRAQRLMSVGMEHYEGLCNELKNFGSVTIQSSHEFNLLTCLQEVLDEIEADVVYENEMQLSELKCNSDRKAISDHVLMNIKDNIQRHAFGTLQFFYAHVWDRKVFVSVDSSPDEYVIYISNNGSKFYGDVSKVCEDGYCFGNNKHTGHGMYSAKKTMRSLGGDLKFAKINKGIYTTRYTIIIPKK